jgi:hypothetical protein
MAHTTRHVVKVSYVCSRHLKTLEKQAIVVGTKQSRLAIKADRQTRQLGLLALFCAQY